MLKRDSDDKAQVLSEFYKIELGEDLEIAKQSHKQTIKGWFSETDINWNTEKVIDRLEQVKFYWYKEGWLIIKTRLLMLDLKSERSATAACRKLLFLIFLFILF